MNAPLVFQWDGESMIPLRRFRHQCNEDFVVGEFYRMEVIAERSVQSHNHYFAALKERWFSLPDPLDRQFPSVEHLRKFALIRKGYADKESIVFSTPADAKRAAALTRRKDTFAVVDVADSVVTVWTAQSQSRKAMGAKPFQQSKQDVLDYVDELLGVRESEAA